MPNMENYFFYEDYQYQLVSHILVLGAATMAAGLVYFALTFQSLLPKYRISSYLGCVVMVSAGLILYTQYKSWDEAFVYVDTGERSGWVNPAVGPLTDASEGTQAEDEFPNTPQTSKLFSNGYRYMNWSIDVPTLQVQLLAVIGVAGISFVRNAAKFIIAGLAMIYFSYIAQFFEGGFAPWAEGTSTNMFWLFYLLGWLAYLYILYAVYTGVFQQVSHMHPRPRKIMRGIWWLFLGSWTVYGLAIAMPAIAFNVHGAIWRQYLFTFADVVSKVIYGVMISQVALYQSAAEGYEPAIKASQWKKVMGGNEAPDYSAERQWQDEHVREEEAHGRLAGQPR